MLLFLSPSLLFLSWASARARLSPPLSLSLSLSLSLFFALIYVLTIRILSVF